MITYAGDSPEPLRATVNVAVDFTRSFAPAPMPQIANHIAAQRQILKTEPFSGNYLIGLGKLEEQDH